MEQTHFPVPRGPGGADPPSEETQAMPFSASSSPPGWGSALLGPDTDKARFPAQNSVALVKVTPSPLSLPPSLQHAASVGEGATLTTGTQPDEYLRANG